MHGQMTSMARATAEDEDADGTEPSKIRIWNWRREKKEGPPHMTMIWREKTRSLEAQQREEGREGKGEKRSGVRRGARLGKEGTESPRGTRTSCAEQYCLDVWQ